MAAVSQRESWISQNDGMHSFNRGEHTLKGCNEGMSLIIRDYLLYNSYHNLLTDPRI